MPVLLSLANTPETGVFDIGNAETGKTKKITDLEKEIHKTIRDLADDHGNAKESEVVSGLERHFDKYAVERLIDELTRSGGSLMRPKNGFLRVA